MQCQPLDGIGMAAILAVAADGVPLRAHVHAQLVLQSLAQRQLHQCHVGTAFQHHEACLGKFAFLGIVGRVHGIVVVTVVQVTLDKALVIVNNALDHCLVVALQHHLSPVFHQFLASLGGAREQHQARGVAVKPVHDEHASMLIAALHIFAHHAKHGVVFHIACSRRQHSVAFVNHQYALVFIHQFQVGMLEHIKRAAIVHPNLVAFLHGIVKLGGGSAVHRQLTVPQQRLHLGCIMVGEQQARYLEQAARHGRFKLCDILVAWLGNLAFSAR